MVSNLDSAKALITADLAHAKTVLELWTKQIVELEKALGQLDAVGTSRGLLHIEYTGKSTSDPLIESGRLANKKLSRAAKPEKNKSKITADMDSQKSTFLEKTAKKHRGRGRKGAAKAGVEVVGNAKKPQEKKHNISPSAVRYQDPESGRIWAGRGRRPLWIKGDADQYLVSNRVLSSRSSMKPQKSDAEVLTR